MKETMTTPRTKPSDRSDAIEGAVHEVFRDRNLSIDERAERGLALLTQKLTDDITAQHDHICSLDHEKNPSAVDTEICRLLRMLEKRKKLFSKLEGTFRTES